MQKKELVEGDILQINPEHENFGGFLLIVTDPKEWGAQGYLMNWHDFEAIRYKDRAFLRVTFEQVEYCGRIAWICKNKEQE